MARFGRTGGRFRNLFGPWAAQGVLPRASLTTAMTGTNNDILYTARTPGTDANSVTVAHVVAGANTPLTVTRSGNAVTVNVATNGSSAATSTAAQVIAAVNASDAARVLVNAENAAGNDGTGVVAAFGATALTGGDVASMSRGQSRPTSVPFLHGRKP